MTGRCQVIIATPGRLIDVMQRNAVRFDGIKFVVLDEADRMLDIGFRPDVERILDKLPSRAPDPPPVRHDAEGGS